MMTSLQALGRILSSELSDDNTAPFEQFLVPITHQFYHLIQLMDTPGKDYESQVSGVIVGW